MAVTKNIAFMKWLIGHQQRFEIFTHEFLSLASFMNINISNFDILLEGVTNCMQAFRHASMNQLQSMKCDSHGFN